jgi:hypothetical protein
MSWRRQAVVTSLEFHPNLSEIVRVLNRIRGLTDRDVARLAGAWRDSSYLAVARDHALAPDSPLVIDVLHAFDCVDAVFDGELGAREVPDAAMASESFTTALKPQVVSNALKAIRDALAAAYARPILSRAEYLGLMGPWRGVFPAERP